MTMMRPQSEHLNGNGSGLGQQPKFPEMSPWPSAINWLSEEEVGPASWYFKYRANPRTNERRRMLVHRATVATVPHVRVVTPLPNVISMSVMKTAPFGVGTYALKISEPFIESMRAP